MIKITELSSLPGPQFANAHGYAAQELGFYEQEGIDYTIEYPGSTVKTTQAMVAGGTGLGWLDTFGIMVSNSQGFPLKALYMTRQGNSFGFAVTPDSPIETWDAASIQGKKLGISEFGGGEVPVLRGALFRLGLEEGTDFELIPVGEGGPDTVEALQSKTVDLFAGSTIDFATLEKSGVPLRVISPEYLTLFPGHTYATTPEILESSRDLLVGFLRARTKGLIFGRENPEAAAQIGIDYAPASAEGLDLQGIVEYLQAVRLDVNEQYFEEGSPVFHKWGTQDPAAWADYQNFLIEAGVEDEGATLSEPINIDEVVTNELIDDVSDFDYDEVVEIARNYTP